MENTNASPRNVNAGPRKSYLARALRAGRWLLAAAVAYVVIGNAFHHWFLPLPDPDPATFPRAGDTFGSTVEGFEQRITGVVDDWVVGELVIAPGAPGPPIHYHREFAEEFTVREGILHLELPEGIVRVREGETFRIEPYTPHRPFNPGSERAVVASEDPFMPQSFAACLVQLYPLLDDAGGPSLTLLLRMSIADPICDTHPDIPRPVLAGVNLLMAPAARLLGHTNYDASRSLHPPGRTVSEAAL